MLRLGEKRDELGVVADQLGGSTYAGHIADTMLTIIQKLESADRKTRSNMYSTPAKRPQSSTLSCSKISDVFGIEASGWKRALQENFLR